MTHDGDNFKFSFWAISCPFTTFTLVFFLILLVMQKVQKMQSVNTQNDYETTSKNEQIKREQNCSVFKFQENKFKIIQKNF